MILSPAWQHPAQKWRFVALYPVTVFTAMSRQMRQANGPQISAGNWTCNPAPPPGQQNEMPREIKPHTNGMCRIYLYQGTRVTMMYTSAVGHLAQKLG